MILVTREFVLTKNIFNLNIFIQLLAQIPFHPRSPVIEEIDHSDGDNDIVSSNEDKSA